MAIINPYLNFQGNTEEAFNFYKSVFGGDFRMLMRFGEVPGMDNTPENVKNMLMHVSLPVGDTTLMGTDAVEGMGDKLQVGNNIHLSFHSDSREQADNVFNKLAAGGNVRLAMGDQFWGDYYGQVVDKFGVSWMISHTPPKK